jgi:hypothetical protein
MNLPRGAGNHAGFNLCLDCRVQETCAMGVVSAETT